MRKFLLDLLLFTAILVTAIVALILGGAANYDSYVRSHAVRMSLAEQSSEPRVLVVGDSSAAFGLNAGILGERAGMPAVNLALHGGLDIDFPLNEAEWILRPGDVVLLSFNWELLGNPRPHWTGALGISVLAADPSAAASVGAADWISVLDEAHLAVGQSLAWGAKAWGRKLRGRPPLEPPAPYGVQYLDAHADLVGHCGRPQGPLRIVAHRADAARLSQRCERLAAFVRAATQRGARVFWASGPVLGREGDSARLEAIEAAREQLLARTALPELATPSEERYADDDFYDSSAHLDCEARDERSARIGTRLREALGAGR